MNLTIPVDLCRGVRPVLEPTANTWFAGGAIRRWFTGEPQNSDVDVFARDESALAEFVKTHSLGAPFLTHVNADSYKHQGQIYQTIKLYSSSPTETMEKFDFCHCQFAYHNGEIIATREAVICALRKSLLVAKIQPGYEIDSLRRAFKYLEQGYRPCYGCLRDLGASFVGLTSEAINTQIEISPSGRKRIVRID